MDQPAPQRSDRALPVAALIAVAGVQLPSALALVTLAFMRPDLFRPMLEDLFGYLFFSVVALMWFVQGAVVGLTWGRETGTGAKVGVTVGALALCTLPMILLIIFGPIVFAYVFGNTE